VHRDLIRPTLSMPAGKSLGLGNLFSEWRRLICAGEPEACLSVEGREAAVFRQPIAEEVGRGNLSAVLFNDQFLLLSLEGRFHDTVNYRLCSEGWTRLHFRNSARTSMLFDGMGQADLNGPLCQLLHQPAGVDDGEWIEPNVDLNWITLFVRPELLGERLGFTAPGMPPPIIRLAGGADEFVLQNRSIAPEIIQAMTSVFRCSYPHDLRRIYLEAKSVELASLLAYSMMAEPVGQMRNLRLSARDVDGVHAARQILASEFANPPGFEALARRVGINRNKLAVGFRQEFRTTVADFVLDCRMREALELLRGSALPIALIAERVGYAQAASFATAFRQRFGLTPRDARLGHRLPAAVPNVRDSK